MKLGPLFAGGSALCRHRLVSLWDLMKPFLAHVYIEDGVMLGRLAEVFANEAGPIPTDERDSFTGVIARIHGLCQGAGLVAASEQTRRMVISIERAHCTYGELAAMAGELHNRIIDELKGSLFLHLSLGEAAHFQTPHKGWESVIENFPSAVTDIEESSKCFALSRYTATVFHMMRSLEPALAAISDALGINKHSPTWNAYLEAMPKAIAVKFPNKDKTDSESREYYSGLEAQLRAIKTAWRNPTMHDVAKTYTEEMASELIVLVRSFMREAAKKHDEFTAI